MARLRNLLDHILAAVSALKTGTVQIAQAVVAVGHRVVLALASLVTGVGAPVVAMPGMAGRVRLMTLAQAACLTQCIALQIAR